MMPAKALLLTMGFVLPFRSVFSQVVISEVMFDPAGSENSDEFVELVNVSSGDTIDLRGWRLGDGTGDDALKDAGNGLRLSPNQYAVILDPDYFEQSTSYDLLIPAEALVVTVEGNTLGSGGLSNTKTETVTIIDSEGKAVDRCPYHTGNKPGYSDERIDLNDDKGPENWVDGNVLNGTPGRRNSAAKVLCNLNLINLFFNKSPGGGSLKAVVLNDGSMTIYAFTLQFFEDANSDSILDEKEMIADISYGQNLGPGDSTVISIHCDLQPGIHFMAARAFMENDEKQEDDIRYSRIAIEYPEKALVINEIMYNPALDNGEWIELLNVQPVDVDLVGWSISDRDTSNRIELCPVSRTIPAGGYFVIAGDSSLLERHPELSIKIIAVHQFPSLNNDSDSVNLYDPSGNRIDHVDYFNIRGGGKGISLERVDPRRVTNDMDNWHFCISRDGATPGEPNSVYSVSRILEGSMDIQPNPFSPDGDGWEEAACISFNLPFEEAYVNLRIYDICGRIIRSIERAERTGKTGRFIWDGRDDLDNPVSIGQYIVFLEASDQNGGRVFRYRSVLVLVRKM
jgi:hypothetical protein